MEIGSQTSFSTNDASFGKKFFRIIQTHLFHKVGNPKPGTITVFKRSCLVGVILRVLLVCSRPVASVLPKPKLFQSPGIVITTNDKKGLTSRRYLYLAVIKAIALLPFGTFWETLLWGISWMSMGILECIVQMGIIPKYVQYCHRLFIVLDQICGFGIPIGDDILVNIHKRDPPGRILLLESL